MIAVLVFLELLSNTVFSQQGKPAPLRVTVGLTLVPVTVTDAKGTSVQGLTRERFRLFEDGVEQEIRFLQMDDMPLSVAVLFDASKSMTGRLDRSRSAMAQVFERSSEGDEFLLVEFNDSPRLLAAYTTDLPLLQSKLMDIVPRNWTALLDAVYLGVHYSRQARHSRKAMLILSDGEDNHSRYSESEIRSLIRESDIAIYGLRIEGSNLLRRPNNLLRAMANQTGGLYFGVEKVSDLPEAVRKISAAMHGVYVLGYRSSSRKSEGQYRRIEVRVDGPRLNVSYRRGYAPVAQ